MSEELVPFEAAGWSYQQTNLEDGSDYSAPTFDDSAWPIASAAFGDGSAAPGNQPWPESTWWPTNTRIWLRRRIPAGSDFVLTGYVDDAVDVWWNGNYVGTFTNGSAVPMIEWQFEVPADFVTPGEQVLAVRASDEPDSVGGTSFIDVHVAGIRLSATRQFPRDDTLGASASPRLHPPPKASRIVGGYP